MSTLRVNNLTNQANDGGIEFAVQPVIDGLCKAWVNFNGSGTVAIRASYNVSSITDSGTGQYRVTFSTAMPDVNYAVSGVCSNHNNSWSIRDALSDPTTTFIDFQSTDVGGNTPQDSEFSNVVIHR